MTQILTTVDEVIDAIGRTRLYEITGMSPQSVTNARRDKRLPSRLYLLIDDELRRLRSGIRADPALFGMVLPPSGREEAVA